MGRAAALALLLLWPGLALSWSPLDDSSLALTGANVSTKGEDGPNSLVYTDDGKIQLKLCECERAEGAPGGLSCSKQGWFISSFERQGQWVAGGGYVPLSHAICCRPCLPTELPADPSGRIAPGQKPLAVMSLGCHGSTDELPVRCEGSGRSFAAGFSQGVRVFTTLDTQYPVNTVSCCTPALLLENGGAWELERCDCHDSQDPRYPVNCGGLDTDELLFGYIFYRTSPLGHLVPVGPAQCCKVCLSPTVHPVDQCDDLGDCSHNGVCNLGQCQCFEGWAGADCSRRVGGGSGHGVPAWAITLIVLSSVALAGVFLIAASRIIELVQESESNGSESGDERQPLLIRIDPDDAGSVGSQDTECDEDELEEVQDRVNTVLARLEAVAPGSSGYRPPSLAEGGGHAPGTPQHSAAEHSTPASPVSSPRVALATAAAAAARGAEGEAAQRTAAPATPAEQTQPQQRGAADEPASPHSEHSAQPEGELSAAAGEAEVAEEAGAAAEPGAAPAAAEVEPAGGEGPAGPAGPEGPEKEEGESSADLARFRHDPESTPLNAVECIVCFSRPVQVVLVPCGHVCICRRCSRKLHRCPVCRKDIARRQKLYI